MAMLSPLSKTPGSPHTLTHTLISLLATSGYRDEWRPTQICIRGNATNLLMAIWRYNSAMGGLSAREGARWLQVAYVCGCLSVYICVYMYVLCMYVCICECVQVYRHVSMSEVDLGCHSSGTLHLVCSDRVSHWHGACQALVGQPQRPACPCPPGAGVIGTCYYAWLFFF